jgi:hypothetical protein
MRELVRGHAGRMAAVLGAVCLWGSGAHADPVITGFSRDRAPLQSIITVYGSDLGEAQGSNYLLVGDRGVPILAWNAGAVTFILNPLAFNPTPVALDTAYPVQVVKRVDNKRSNTLNLTITSEPPFVPPTPAALPAPSDQPSISGFQVPQFCRNRQSAIAIYGAGFGAAPSGMVTVAVPFLNAQGQLFTQPFALPVMNWTENALQVLFQAPPGAQLGPYTLTVQRANGKTATSTFLVVNCPSP